MIEGDVVRHERRMRSHFKSKMKNAAEEQPRTKTHSREEQQLFFLEEQNEERTMKHHQLIYFFLYIYIFFVRIKKDAAFAFGSTGRGWLNFQ